MNKASEGMSISGAVEILHRNGITGKTHRTFIPNAIMNFGGAWVVQRFLDPPPGKMTHMAVGESGVNPTDRTLTSLMAQIVDGGIVPFSNAVTNLATITYSGSWGAGDGDGEWAEAGLFDNATGIGSVMLARTTFPSRTKGPLDSVIINWTITVNP